MKVGYFFFIGVRSLAYQGSGVTIGVDVLEPTRQQAIS